MLFIIAIVVYKYVFLDSIWFEAIPGESFKYFASGLKTDLL
jgi:hypothetical protein